MRLSKKGITAPIFLYLRFVGCAGRPTVPKICYRLGAPTNFDRSAVLIAPFISHWERSQTNPRRTAANTFMNEKSHGHRIRGIFGAFRFLRTSGIYIQQCSQENEILLLFQKPLSVSILYFLCFSTRFNGCLV